MEKKEGVRMAGFVNDLRYALRSLVRNPVFTGVAVLTLALGIGANTAVFTLVDGVLIRPLPFGEPQELLSMEHLGRDGQDELPISPGLYLLYKEQVSNLEAVAMYVPSERTMLVEGEPERVPVQVVSPSFFDVLGVPPAQGRAFLSEEENPGSEPVVILSYGLWQRSFGGEANVLDQTVDLSGLLARVVGVMPRDFGYPDREAQAWLPLQVNPAQAPLASFGAYGIARMSKGSTLEGVEAEIESLITRLGELFPEDGAVPFLQNVGLRSRIRPLKEVLVGDVNTTLWILLGTVGFVLLIACANVANLLLVRAETRQRELAMRRAIGAGRSETIRFFMGESVVLAAVGGALGASVAAWSLHVTKAFIPVGFPRMAEVGVDVRVLGFTLLVSLGCAIFFGLFPMVRYGAGDLANQLKDGGGRGATGSRERHRLRNGLVMVQVAMALVLLVGAGLMFRSFQALRSLDPGYDVGGIATASITVTGSEIQDWQEVASFFQQLQDRLAGQAGVEAVAFTQTAPLAGGMAFTTMAVEDHPRGPEDTPVFANWMSVGPGYFHVLGIDIVEGRPIETQDGALSTRGVVVSENFARRWWPDTSPIGRRLGGGGGGPDGEDWWEIVGVAEDVHQLSLEEAPEEMIYFPLSLGTTAAPRTVRTVDILVKTSGSPIQSIPLIRRELRVLNPRIPLSNPRTMQDVLDRALAPTSFTMTMLGAASGIALLLGLVGIYGVISYVVSQRTREIGVRMAMGATGPSVRGMVVRLGVVLAGAGVVLGLLVAGGMSRVMSSLLFGVSPLDPLTFGAVAVALMAVAALASWIPAQRAAGVDPSRALRED
jgi:predicted permease